MGHANISVRSGLRRPLTLLAAAAFALAAAACAPLTGYPDSAIDPQTELNSLQDYLKPEVISNYNASNNDVRGGLTRQAYRDQIVYARMRSTDIQYTEFKKALVKDNSVFDIGSDWLVLGLNALGATTGGAATKSALHAASGGIIGARGAVDKDLFYQKTLPALIAQMDAGRATVRVTIETGLQDGPEKYPLSKAIVDLGNYETAGSIPAAISAIVTDAGAKADKAAQSFTLLRGEEFIPGRQKTAGILNTVVALSPDKALTLAKLMEPNLTKRNANLQATVKATDPNNKRLTDGKAAKAFLQRWAALDDRDAASQKQWTDALDAVK